MFSSVWPRRVVVKKMPEVKRIAAVAGFLQQDSSPDPKHRFSSGSMVKESVSVLSPKQKRQAHPGDAMGILDPGVRRSRRKCQNVSSGTVRIVLWSNSST
jgi:hypothetical protein